MYLSRKMIFKFNKILNRDIFNLYIYPVIFIILCLIFLTGAASAEKVKITQHNIRMGVFRRTGELDVNVKIENLTKEERDVWLGYSLRDPHGIWHDIEPRNLKIKADSGQRINFKEIIFKQGNIIPGEYLFITALWDDFPGNDAQRLTEDRKQKKISDRNDKNKTDNRNLRKEFSGYIFLKAVHRLGRGWLRPDNVIYENKEIKILSPSASYHGGELRTERFFGYGTYKVMMKTDYAPGSFSAFFLYQDVQNNNDEIDIEIYNDGSRRIDFVTFTGGEKTNHKTLELPFDPASNYHEYRIDYSPEQISFYVEGKLTAVFDNKLPSTPMRIIVNHWWPTWVEGEAEQKTSEIYIKAFDFQEF